ncbi:MAG TPA: HAD hydrolase-like protein [Clostridia bacterium]|nr:HAD hydrolase-like protein [Clostridia bacterium]
MSNYEIVLFDVDGTLLDTKPGILRCVKKALTGLGIPIPPESKLNLFMGPPIKYCFTDVCGLDEETAEQAIRLFRADYEETGLYQSTVYDGVRPLLENLSFRGLRLGVATSKAEHMAATVLKYHGLSDYFEAVGGAPRLNYQSTKADSIRSALRDMNAPLNRKTVLVGDRKFDAEGAKQTGIDNIGVLYGYGPREEILSCFGQYAATTSELEKLILDETPTNSTEF